MATLKFTSTLLVLVFFSAFCSLETSADKAIPLITVKKNHGDSEYQFVLNPDAIAKIKKLSSPVKVISAIGDARVGKSTALNFIHHHILKKSDPSARYAGGYEEVFKTGSTMEVETRGVWISTIKGNNGMDDILLLDVEGTDLGDDTVTDKLSIFTVLMSSGITLFMKESPSTHITDFLYKIVRLSELAFGENDSEYFPHLTAILRGALELPNGRYSNINDYIKDFLIKPTWGDELDEKRKAIGTRFSGKRITVFNLTYISNPHILKDLRELSSSEYLSKIETLTSKLLELPEKKTLGGGVMDGQTLADLAERLLKVMNDENLWEGLNPSFYSLFEEDVCRKSYRDFVKPLLEAKTMTAKELKNQKDENMKVFKERCILKEKVQSANRDIEDAIKRQVNYEKESGFWNKVKIVATFCAGYVTHVAYGAAFSDLQLKENVTLLNNSEYETIGLHGVGWVWNKEAERLGLSGRGSGVVAQEVELFYPWAVTEGHDGYKRVNYFALRLLIMTKKCGQRLDDKNQTYQDPKLFQHIDYSTKIYKANQQTIP